jgi:hypothetical protein
VSGNGDGGSHTHGVNPAAISSQLHAVANIQDTLATRLAGSMPDVSDAMVAAVAAAASAAAAAAAAAVVAAAGQHVQAHMQHNPPAGFPFFGIPPALLAQMAAINMPQLEQTSSQVPSQTPCALGMGSGLDTLVLRGSEGDRLTSMQPPSAPLPLPDLEAAAGGAAAAAAAAAAARGANGEGETATTDGFNVTAANGGAARGSDGDSACSRETANPQDTQDAAGPPPAALEAAAWQLGAAAMPGMPGAVGGAGQLAWQLGATGALPWPRQQGWAGAGQPDAASAAALAANPFLLISECLPAPRAGLGPLCVLSLLQRPCRGVDVPACCVRPPAARACLCSCSARGHASRARPSA